MSWTGNATAAGSRRSSSFPASSPTVKIGTRLSLERKLSRYACSPSALITEKLFPILLTSPSPSPRETVEGLESQGRSGRTHANWLAHQTSVGFPPDTSEPGWADYVFAFHDKDEIGPVMLGRIARKTGLRPEDL